MKQITAILTLTLLALGLFLGSGPALAGESDGKLELNAVTMEELVKVPGLTQDLAEGILELREENGEFVDMEELLDVDGIDNKLLRQINKHIYIDSAASCNC